MEALFYPFPLELPVKATYSVIPANPGSGPGQALESKIARRSWIPGRALP
jgi:hypothetical protein